MSELILEKKVLDHGFVKLRNLSGCTRRQTMGVGDIFLQGEDDYGCKRPFDADDTDPANTARISFDNLDSSRSREDDLKLYEYLVANEHSTPVEMVETWWEMKMPIFIARQFVRHRAATINEVSGRYATLPAEWYIPEVVGGKAKSNKQGQEDNLASGIQTNFKKNLQAQCKESYNLYSEFLEEGVAPEHARMFLHLNHYTHWVFKIDLRNLFNFLKLRLDHHAQVEARVYAEAMYDILKQYLPKSMELFDEYIRKASIEEQAQLKAALELLDDMLSDTEIDRECLVTIKKFMLRVGVKL